MTTTPETDLRMTVPRTAQEPTIVIFRVWGRQNGGSVLAIFPAEPYSDNEALCMSYEHMGMHSGADYYGCLARTRPAKPEEYASLRRELEGLGYTLRVVQKASRDHHEKRREWIRMDRQRRAGK